MARFRHPERQGEVPYDEAWLADHGFRHRARSGRTALRRRGRRPVLRRYALRRLSHSQRRPRSSADRRNARLPRDSAGARRPLLLSPRHLLLPAGDRTGDLLPVRVRRLRPRGATGHVPELIEVAEEEARCVRLQRGRRGQAVVTNTGCPKLHDALRDGRFRHRAKRRSLSSSKPAAAPSASPCASTAKKRRVGSTPLKATGLAISRTSIGQFENQVSDDGLEANPIPASRQSLLPLGANDKAHEMPAAPRPAQ